MNALEKNIAIARGEALAANLLASAAIQAALTNTSNREEVLARMSAFIDETLNVSGPGRGDAHDEFNTQMRETARFQAMQSLDAIARMFRNPPARG
jgi:regulator of protease activity HflC (stomatin/prohibitin superfamily)